MTVTETMSDYKVATAQRERIDIMTNDRQTKNAASEGTSASHCSQARCECRDPRTVWNGTRNQWICDDCGKPANNTRSDYEEGN